MDMDMVLHIRPECMKNRCHARSVTRFGPYVFDGHPCYFHDQGIDDGFIIARKIIKLMWQGEYGVNIRYFE